MPITSIYGHWATPVTTQSGAYVVQSRDFGSCIQASGATTFTLPRPGPELNGVWIQFVSIAAGDMVINVTGNDSIVTDADAQADSVTYGTATEEIGSSCTFLCDGTGWLHFNNPANVATSKTQAT